MEAACWILGPVVGHASRIRIPRRTTITAVELSRHTRGRRRQLDLGALLRVAEARVLFSAQHSVQMCQGNGGKGFAQVKSVGLRP